MEQWHELARKLAVSRGCGYYGAWADINIARALYGEERAYTGIMRLATEQVCWFEAFDTDKDPNTECANL